MSAEILSDTTHSKATPALIAKLLAERQETLVLFNRLAEMKPYTTVAAVQPILQQFCQLLIDYVALGHFEVYQALEENTESTHCCNRIKQLARELYPRIAETTQIAIEFNDRYDCRKPQERLSNFSSDLSRLGEHLATRIDLEDRLVAAIGLPSVVSA